MRLGIILPTNNPDVFLNDFLPTVTWITELSPISVFLINFQPPWTHPKIIHAVTRLHSKGFYVKSTYTENWDPPVKILKIREQCAQLDPECDVYLSIDDDFKFVSKTDMFPYSSGERYMQSLDYFDKFPDCGIINTKGFLGGYRQGLMIQPVDKDMFATNRGMFLRNMREHGFLLAPKGALDLRGGLEETLLAYTRIERGYFAAKQMNNPTIHVTGTLEKYGDDPSGIHNLKVMDENVVKWIQNKYDDPEWYYQSRRYPDNLKRSYLLNNGPHPLGIEYFWDYG